MSSLYEKLTNGTTQHTEYVDPSTIISAHINIMDKLKDVDNLTDEELGSILDTSYDTILSRLSDNSKIENVMLIRQLFNNKRFVQFFKNCIGQKQLSYTNKVIINKIIYGYKNQIQFKPLKDILDIMKEISNIINLQDVAKLQSLGLSRDFISLLANAANSSSSKNKCVKRVDSLIYNSENEEELTEQMLVDIYSILFGLDILSLVEGVLLDQYPKDVLQNASKSSELYYRINLAVIDIINSMSSDDIEAILIFYKQLCSCYGQDNLRFNFILSNDYERINNVIEKLKVYNDIVI